MKRLYIFFRYLWRPIGYNLRINVKGAWAIAKVAAELGKATNKDNS